MRLLAIDPGAKPGYALFDLTRLSKRKLSNSIISLPRVVHLSTTWDAVPDSMIDSIVVEGQWLFSMAQRAAIATLGITAGAQLYRAHHAQPQATLYVMSPVSDKRRQRVGWRDALELGNTPKNIVQNRTRDCLTLVEQLLLEAIPRGRQSDVLDSILIGWGWTLAPPQPWRIPC